MNNCPKCQSRNALEHTRLDDNRSYQWVPAIHCLKCGWYGYPKATQREMETGVVSHSYPQHYNMQGEQTHGQQQADHSINEQVL